MQYNMYDVNDFVNFFIPRKTPIRVRHYLLGIRIDILATGGTLFISSGFDDLRDALVDYFDTYDSVLTEVDVDRFGGGVFYLNLTRDDTTTKLDIPFYSVGVDLLHVSEDGMKTPKRWKSKQPSVFYLEEIKDSTNPLVDFLEDFFLDQIIQEVTTNSITLENGKTLVISEDGYEDPEQVGFLVHPNTCVIETVEVTYEEYEYDRDTTSAVFIVTLRNEDRELLAVLKMDMQFLGIVLKTDNDTIKIINRTI